MTSSSGPVPVRDGLAAILTLLPNSQPVGSVPDSCVRPRSLSAKLPGAVARTDGPFGTECDGASAGLTGRDDRPRRPPPQRRRVPESRGPARRPARRNGGAHAQVGEAPSQCHGAPVACPEGESRSAARSDWRARTVTAQPTEARPRAARRVSGDGARAGERIRAASDYTARHLSVLEGLEAVRKRPGMYVGSTDSRGLMHCLWEIIDNSVDEALARPLPPDRGRAARRRLGRGPRRRPGHPGRRRSPRPACPASRSSSPSCTPAASSVASSYTASGGLHGVGASVVNALSARLDVEVDRGGQTHAMSFRRGEPGVFEDGRGAPSPEAAFRAVRRSVRAADRRNRPSAA